MNLIYLLPPHPLTLLTLIYWSVICLRCRGKSDAFLVEITWHFGLFLLIFYINLHPKKYIKRIQHNLNFNVAHGRYKKEKKKKIFCYIMSCSLPMPTVIIQAVNMSHLASHRRATYLKVVYFTYTGEKLWAQLWWLPVESMSRSIFLRRWHQRGQLPASCYGCCSLGDYSEEQNSRLYNRSADANTQCDTNGWAIHRYILQCAGMYKYSRQL